MAQDGRALAGTRVERARLQHVRAVAGAAAVPGEAVGRAGIAAEQRAVARDAAIAGLLDVTPGSRVALLD